MIKYISLQKPTILSFSDYAEIRLICQDPNNIGQININTYFEIQFMLYRVISIWEYKEIQNLDKTSRDSLISSYGKLPGIGYCLICGQPVPPLDHEAFNYP